MLSILCVSFWDPFGFGFGFGFITHVEGILGREENAPCVSVVGSRQFELTIL